MASGSHEPLTLDYTPDALSDLNEIWDWNASQYSNLHVDRYIEFLQKQTDRLRSNFPGNPVPTRPDFKYLTIRRRSKGHGHVVVYEVMGNRIRILRYFHTSQNWRDKMMDKAES
jgi:plasmid stabilization system protein ParE